jgi:DNA-binding HxlR family transcriptional regulator
VKRTGRRSDCPINFALETFGDTWSLLVIRDLMFRNKTTYTEFLRSEEGIATNILSSRLRRLEDCGLIRKRGSDRNAAYALTLKGVDLLPAMAEIVSWSATYDPRTAADPTFVKRIRTNKTRLLAKLRAQLRQTHGVGEAPRGRSRRLAARRRRRTRA